MTKALIFQAIQTKYVGPTNTKGSRVIASCQARSVILEWDDAVNQDDNHTRAAMELAKRMKWDGAWFGGALPNGYGCCFVLADRDSFGSTLPSFTVERETA